MATHGQETRERIRITTILVVGFLVIPVTMAGLASLVGLFVLDRPTNLFCAPILLVSLAALWKLMCNWQDKGPVDHYVAPKV